MDVVDRTVTAVAVPRLTQTSLTLQVVDSYLNPVLVLVSGLGLGLVQHLVAVLVEVLLAVVPGHGLQDQDLLAVGVGGQGSGGSSEHVEGGEQHLLFGIQLGGLRGHVGQGDRVPLHDQHVGLVLGHHLGHNVSEVGVGETLV